MYDSTDIEYHAIFVVSFDMLIIICENYNYIHYELITRQPCQITTQITINNHK